MQLAAACSWVHIVDSNTILVDYYAFASSSAARHLETANPWLEINRLCAVTEFKRILHLLSTINLIRVE